MKLRHVVYSHREVLRWYFIDTQRPEKGAYLFLSLNPLDIITSTILRYVQGSKKVISSLLIQGQAEIMEIIASNNMQFANKPLCELDLPDGVLIAAIHRGNQVIIPDGNTSILEDDKVTIFCLLSDITEIEALFKPKRGLFLGK